MVNEEREFRKPFKRVHDEKLKKHLRSIIAEAFKLREHDFTMVDGVPTHFADALANELSFANVSAKYIKLNKDRSFVCYLTITDILARGNVHSEKLYSINIGAMPDVDISLIINDGNNMFTLTGDDAWDYIAGKDTNLLGITEETYNLAETLKERLKIEKANATKNFDDLIMALGHLGVTTDKFIKEKPYTPEDDIVPTIIYESHNLQIKGTPIDDGFITISTRNFVSAAWVIYDEFNLTETSFNRYLKNGEFMAYNSGTLVFTIKNVLYIYSISYTHGAIKTKMEKAIEVLNAQFIDLPGEGTKLELINTMDGHEYRWRFEKGTKKSDWYLVSSNLVRKDI